jgi:uncharacterized membrane protein
MPPLLVAWLSACLIIGVLDGLWLSFAGPRLYRPLIGGILAPGLRVGPAAAFYLLYVTGLIVLAVAPALERGGLGKAALLGAVLGLVAYGTYDLTNHATMKVWDLRVTAADMAWGASMSAIAAAGAYLAAARFI